MREIQKVAIPSPIRIGSINSIHRFDLSALETRGDFHDFHELVFVREGLLSILVDGLPYEIPAGSLFVYAPNAYHIGSRERGSPAVVDIVSFDCDSPAMRYFEHRVLTPSPEEVALLDAFFSAAHATLMAAAPRGVVPREGVTPYALQLLGGRLEQFLLTLYREEPGEAPAGRHALRKERVLALSAYLKAHLGERITLSDMAAASLMSVSGVKALVRGFCDCGPNDYLISLRIARARELIREGERSFTEIAEATGFGTLHYFSRVFRARTGRTPTDEARMVSR